MAETAAIGSCIQLLCSSPALVQDQPEKFLKIWYWLHWTVFKSAQLRHWSAFVSSLSYGNCTYHLNSMLFIIHQIAFGKGASRDPTTEEIVNCLKALDPWWSILKFSHGKHLSHGGEDGGATVLSQTATPGGFEISSHALLFRCWTSKGENRADKRTRYSDHWWEQHVIPASGEPPEPKQKKKLRPRSTARLVMMRSRKIGRRKQRHIAWKQQESPGWSNASCCTSDAILPIDHFASILITTQPPHPPRPS